MRRSVVLRFHPCLELRVLFRELCVCIFDFLDALFVETGFAR